MVRGTNTYSFPRHAHHLVNKTEPYQHAGLLIKWITIWTPHLTHELQILHIHACIFYTKHITQHNFSKMQNWHMKTLNSQCMNYLEMDEYSLGSCCNIKNEAWKSLPWRNRTAGQHEYWLNCSKRHLVSMCGERLERKREFPKLPIWLHPMARVPIPLD